MDSGRQTNLCCFPVPHPPKSSVWANEWQSRGTEWNTCLFAQCSRRGGGASSLQTLGLAEFVQEGAVTVLLLRICHLSPSGDWLLLKLVVAGVDKDNRSCQALGECQVEPPLCHPC